MDAPRALAAIDRKALDFYDAVHGGDAGLPDDLPRPARQLPAPRAQTLLQFVEVER
jgi:hypothetical protein